MAEEVGFEPTPTLPIPGEKTDPNFTLSSGIGGMLELDYNIPQGVNSAFNIVNFSNIIGYTQDTTTRPGYVTIKSTNYIDSSIEGYKSNITSDLGYSSNSTVYLYPAFMSSQIVLNQGPNILGVLIVTNGYVTWNISVIVYIHITSLTYQYPQSFTADQLCDDLKTLPEVAIKSLEQVKDDPTLQQALSMLSDFKKLESKK